MLFQENTYVKVMGLELKKVIPLFLQTLPVLLNHDYNNYCKLNK